MPSSHGSSSSAERITRGTRIGPFVVEAELGRGGMGAVFRVRHETTGAPYALKLLLASIVGSEHAGRAFVRFEREVAALSRLGTHPNIVTLHAPGSHGGKPYFVMEMVEGEPLKARLREKPMDQEPAVRLAIKIARAVEHAHAHGILHRDLKPANILIDARGEPRVLDFGLARLGQDSSLTNTGEMIGTPGYLAPEQVGSESGGYGPPTDVYGLGAVLYHMLCGRRPFKEVHGEFAVVAAVLTRHPIAPCDHRSDLSPELEAIVLQAMEKDPARRYPSAAALADDLERWLRGEPVGAQPLGRLGRIGRRLVPARGARRAAAIAILSVVGLSVPAAGVAGVAWLAVGEQKARRERERALVESYAEAFRLACEGDLDALARAEGIREKIDEAGIAIGVDERTEILARLRRIAAGDRVVFNALDVDVEPWRSHREAIVRVALEAGQSAGLADLVRKKPTLLADWQVVAAVARAIVEEGAEADETLTREVLRALGADGLPPERDELLVAVSARRLDELIDDELLADERKGRVSDELDAVLRPLLPRLERGGGGLGPEQIDRAFDLAEARIAAVAAGRSRDMDACGLAVEVACLLVPDDDPRRDRIHRDLKAVAVDAHAQGGALREKALGLSLILYRQGSAWPYIIELVPIAADVDLAGMLAERTRAAPDDVAGLVMLLELRLEVASQRARPELAASAERDALAAHWASVDAILAREERAHDVPGWVLGRLARILRSAGRPPGVDAGPTLARLGVPDDAAAWGAATVRLFELAMERYDAIAAPWWRKKTLAGHLWMLAAEDAPKGRATPELVARVAALIPQLEQLVNERGDAGWSLRAFSMKGTIRDLLEGLLLALDRSGPAGHEQDPCPFDGAVREVVERGRASVEWSWIPDAIDALHHGRHGRSYEFMKSIAAGVQRAESLNPPNEIGRETLSIDIAWMLLAKAFIARGERDKARAALLEKTSEETLGKNGLRLRRDLWLALGEAARAAADDERARRIIRSPWW